MFLFIRHRKYFLYFMYVSFNIKEQFSAKEVEFEKEQKAMKVVAFSSLHEISFFTGALFACCIFSIFTNFFQLCWNLSIKLLSMCFFLNASSTWHSSITLGTKMFAQGGMFMK